MGATGGRKKERDLFDKRSHNTSTRTLPKSQQPKYIEKLENRLKVFHILTESREGV